MPESTRTVYIVDDDPHLLRSLERLLRYNRYEARAFKSAESFLASPRSPGNSCLVLDINLPELDGLDLQERLLSEDGPPIVFITGCGDISSSVQAMKSGAVDFIEKPFDDTVLIEAINRALQKDEKHRVRRYRLDCFGKRYESLTTREQDVMKLVVRGYLNKQIGFELSIAEKTVKVHRGRVMEKMEVESLAELVLVADELGLFAERAKLLRESVEVR